MLGEFAGAYNKSGTITDPNQHDPQGHDQSRKFQDQLCKSYRYEKSVTPPNPFSYPSIPYLTKLTSG